MPSLQVVTENIPVHEEGAVESSPDLNEEEKKIDVPRQSAQNTKPAKRTQQRRITPTGAESTAAPAAKTKQQASLVSFFGKSKFPSTPSVAPAKDSKKKAATAAKAKKAEEKFKPPPTKKSAAALTTPAAASTASTNTAAVSLSATGKPRPKMDFKNIIVGNLSNRKSTSQSNPCSKSSSTTRRKGDLDALLPRIPPLSDVQAQKLPAATTTKGAESQQTIDLAASQDESDEGEAISDVRSQLVHKFETPGKDATNSDDEVELVEVDSEENSGGAEEVLEPSKSLDTKDDDKANAAAKNDSATLNEETEQKTEEPVSLPALLPQAGTTDAAHLNSESTALLQRHETMRIKYCKQANKLVLHARKGFAEEAFEIAMPSTEDLELSFSEEFPDAAVPHLVCLLEGSKLPLSKLADKACESMKGAFDGKEVSLEVVSSKIKLLAGRKPYVKNPAVASGMPMANVTAKDIDVFEDVNPDYMWRWEVTTLDLLPEDSVKSVKAARSVRRKLQTQFNATARLLGALNESIKLLGDAKSKAPKTKIDKVVSKISREEEKVLKFEQEAEKARLSAEAKKQKEVQKDKKSKAEKERQKEEKRRDAEAKKREKEEAKQKKTQEKEEAKHLREEKERKQQLEKQKAQEKQKKRMMSFFGGPVKKKAKKTEETAAKTPAAKAPTSSDKATAVKCGFDSDQFQSGINSLASVDKTSVFSSLSKHAIESRKRKTNIVKMRVFVSGVNADDPFAAPAFAEERIVEIRDRNKFLKFREDCRPPYHGTWSKRSVVNGLGRKPFSKEPTLEYDVDSEAEWEEGDDDAGEDVENDAGDDEDEKILDREGDTREYNYQDGWLAQDDDIIKVDDAEMDEQTKALVKASKQRAEGALVPVCIVAPAVGGVPMVEKFKSMDDPLLKKIVEGFPVEDAYKLVTAHKGAQVSEPDLFLDPFPPMLVEERDSAAANASPPPNRPSEEDMKTIVKFVHHSKLVSKSQVIEELRTAHPTVTASRAQTQRILDSIAEKKRHPTDGVYWEVKQDVIDKHGLGDELKPMVLPEPVAKAPRKDAKAPRKDSKKRKKSEGSDAAVSTAKKAKTAASSGGSDAKSKSGSAKKPQVSKASANLLAAFLKKPA